MDEVLGAYRMIDWLIKGKLVLAAFIALAVRGTPLVRKYATDMYKRIR